MERQEPRLLLCLSPLRHGNEEIVYLDQDLKVMKVIRMGADRTITVTLTREGDDTDYSYRIWDTQALRDVLKRFHAALLTDPEAVRILQEREKQPSQHKGETQQ